MVPPNVGMPPPGYHLPEYPQGYFAQPHFYPAPLPVQNQNIIAPVPSEPTTSHPATTVHQSANPNIEDPKNPGGRYLKLTDSFYNSIWSSLQYYSTRYLQGITANLQH